MKDVIITRKLEIYPFEGSKENNVAVWKKLRAWQRDVRTAANLVSSQMYTLDRLQEYFFLTEEVKVKLANQAKDPKGILTTSHQNTAYQALSAKFKGQVPMAIMASLSSQIVQTYKAEKADYYAGRRSLRSYRDTMPIPIPAAAITKWTIQAEKNNNYTFELFGMSFITRFGRDLSNNRVMLERALSGQYKLCDSSIKLEDSKMFLLAVLKLPETELELSNEREVRAELSVLAPIVANFDNETVEIGTTEDFLYKRKAIQAGLHRAQKAAKENQGGRGRKHKLRSIKQFEEAETNFVSTKLHTYSRRLIDFCVDRGAKRLILCNQKEKEQQAKDDHDAGKHFVLRNWSYYGLIEKIKYKAAQKGIELIVE